MFGFGFKGVPAGSPARRSLWRTPSDIFPGAITVRNQLYSLELPSYNEDNQRIIPPTPEVQVFTLGSPAWGRLGPYHFLQSPSPVLVSGMLHWCTWPQKYGPCRLLISLDLADERFRVVPKPDCGGLERCYFDLVNLGVTCLLLHIANLEYLRSGL
ncbi:hypothetical protein KPL70_003946 [Citrus sinensis]|nr:hypothetical protein KPL70_003946 [Citrus sinensis]